MHSAWAGERNPQAASVVEPTPAESIRFGCTASETPRTPSHGARRAGAERRRRRRYPYGLEISGYRFGYPDKPWVARMKDISSKGFNVLLRDCLGPKTVVCVAGKYARVANVRMENGIWTHGCAFINHLTADDLREIFGICLPNPCREERRGQPRHLCQLAASSRFGRAIESEPGALMNISSGGVNIALPRALEPGTSLVVELPESGTRLIPVGVVHVRSGDEGGQWLHGCAFANALIDGELEELLSVRSANLDCARTRNLVYRTLRKPDG